jgi:hypothetical protein
MTPSTTAALTAMQAANNSGGELSIKTLIAFLIVAYSLIFGYWIVRYFMYLFKKPNYTTTIDYVFGDGDDAAVLIGFYIITFIVVFVLLVESVKNLL